jgi:hypothetical protein
MRFDMIIGRRTAKTRSPSWNERGRTFLLKALQSRA